MSTKTGFIYYAAALRLLLALYLFHLHERIISRRERFCTHETSLTLPLYIDVPVPSQERARSCVCMLGVFILHLFIIRFFD